MTQIRETKYYKLVSQWHFRYENEYSPKAFGNDNPSIKKILKSNGFGAPVFDGSPSLASRVKKNLTQFGYTVVDYGDGPHRECCNPDKLLYTYKIQHETPTPHLCECIVCRMVYVSDGKESQTLREKWHTHPLSDCMPKKRIYLNDIGIIQED